MCLKLCIVENDITELQVLILFFLLMTQPVAFRCLRSFNYHVRSFIPLQRTDKAEEEIFSARFNWKKKKKTIDFKKRNEDSSFQLNPLSLLVCK